MHRFHFFLFNLISGTLILFLTGKIAFSQPDLSTDILNIPSLAQLPLPVTEKDVLDKIEFNEPEKESVEIIDKASENKNNTLAWRKPVSFHIGRTSYSFDYSGRLQSRFDYYTPGENSPSSHKLYFRRIRFKSKGHLFTPEFRYKLEVDLLNMQILDLILKWKAGKHFSIWAGQTKLRGNRERVISSQNLQFVDRSLLNSKFTLDRDIGIWVMHERVYGNVAIREILSVSRGEGKDYALRDIEQGDPGLDYTGRIEILPFGYFTGNGDYSASDLARERTPKLAIGFTYDYNNHAIRSNGQKGDILDIHGNLSSFVADAMFKYNGFSWMSEFTNRKVFPGTVPALTNINPCLFYTGKALNTQMGYLFMNDFEIASRFTYVNPEESTEKNDLTEYTIGISKYLNGHKLKIQSDFSLLQEATKDNTCRFRLQMEFSI